jgi:signal transduction histidine kinase
VAVGDEAFGNLYLTEKVEGFTDQDVMVVEALSRIAGSAVTTARLHERLRRVAVVEDRQRIARDLHDSVIQEMFAVGLALQGISQLVESPQVEATLLDSVDRLDKSVESLRRYIFQLRTVGTAERTLDEQVQELVARMASAYPANVSLSVTAKVTADPDVDEEVLRIVGEALSNALRHSGAHKVEVELTADAETCVVVVSDDGEGFDVDGVPGGMGLGNLRTRVHRLGGELGIKSSRQGTVVRARLPLR